MVRKWRSDWSRKYSVSRSNQKKRVLLQNLKETLLLTNLQPLYHRPKSKKLRSNQSQPSRRFSQPNPNSNPYPNPNKPLSFHRPPLLNKQKKSPNLSNKSINKKKRPWFLLSNPTNKITSSRVSWKKNPICLRMFNNLNMMMIPFDLCLWMNFVCWYFDDGNGWISVKF